MKRIFFIGFALFFFDRLDAKTHLRDISGVTKKAEGRFTSYEISISSIPAGCKTVKVSFPSDGQQPSSAEVSLLATPQQELFSRIFYKEFFTLLHVFEDAIPEEFEILTQNPIGRALLYRICIELLRVNDEGKSCFPDGTARPEKSIQGIHFVKTDPVEPCFEGLSYPELLFFKLLEYFYKLQPKREVEVLKKMLYATYDEAEVEKYIAHYKPLLGNDKKVVLFLFTWFRISHLAEDYLPGDELSLGCYLTSKRQQDVFKILNSGYKKDSDAINQSYTLHITVEHKEKAFVVHLTDELAFPCFQISDVFDTIYGLFYKSLNCFEPHIPYEFSGAHKDKAYDRWHRLTGRIHSFYVVKEWHPYASTPKIQHLDYVFYISVKREDKPTHTETFSLSYDCKNNISHMPSEEFWASFECWVNRLLKQPVR